MVNILLSANKFDYNYMRRKLRRFIRKRNNVLIIPLAYHEDYVNDADSFSAKINKSHPDVAEIINSFASYGIPSKNIRILNCHGDSKDTVANKFRRADILFFMGGYPDKLMARIDEFELREYICSFDGVVMGASAGAMVQFDTCHVTPEEDGQEFYYCNGLGLLSGFDIEVHYRERYEQVCAIYKDLCERGLPIAIIPDGGGVIFHNGDRILLGDVFVADERDIDIFKMFSEDKQLCSWRWRL